MALGLYQLRLTDSFELCYNKTKHHETIRLNVTEIEHKPRALSVSVTDTILQAARREISGEITTLEARKEIEKLINLAADLKEKDDAK